MQGEIQQEFLATFNKLNMNDITGDVKEARKSLDDLMDWIQQSDLLKSQKDFVDTLPKSNYSATFGTTSSFRCRFSRKFRIK
ncbi:hypothetical protein [Bacillus mycoides]|uniref:hypothetical protein n=1 Tax=Bacillus mycoides TaxID=1405 RepID=UPI001C038402|nr:hypothetical protein [Bacillus mycoides]QWH51515.1 hypothetical protein EXW44_15495 [Bacillus mycoides]QWJ03490.1 hypothetical protein J5V93_15185 [Bacillus mycoides]